MSAHWRPVVVMETVDVLIIGAGASGAAVAWSLSEMKLNILCLEQGDRMDAGRYPSTQRNWEVQRLGPYNVSPNVRKLPSDYPINDQDSPIAIANFNGVGGSTILYSGHFPRFHPSDFKVKTLDGVADDWPIDYDLLDPYFALNDKMMGVSGLGGDPAYPPIEGLQPPVPMGRMGEKIGEGFNKLGWHWWPAYSAIITRPHKGRDRCINLGPCNTGCAQGAKSSVDITYWPEALRNGVKLKTRARVREITVDSRGLANGVIYYDETGAECVQRARMVIVACSGVGTPRLLLNSRSTAFPDGLANSSGMVGKNLMLHPLGYVEGVFEEPLDSHLGPHGCCILGQEFYETDQARGYVRGYTMQVLRGPGPIETAMAGLARRDIPWGQGHHAAFAARFGHTIGMGIIVEDLPEPTNTVTLDPELKDAHGIPAPKVTYRLSENSKKMLAHGLERGKEVMTAAGSVKNFAFGPVRNTGWHLMGTARMGHDPATSVVDASGRCHDVPNLFVVDSSIFVTSGGVNPVSTMQAVALYIADNIKKNLSAILG
jgi:choline dehydrogenase-like flavoprotein